MTLAEQLQRPLTLEQLILDGQDARRSLRQVVHTLVAGHSTAYRGPEVQLAGLPDALRAGWNHDADLWEPVARRVIGVARIDRSRSLINRFLAGRRSILLARIAADRIVMRSGDPTADGIVCTQDGAEWVMHHREIGDAVAGDELVDLAVLVAEMEVLGRADLAQFVVRRYRSLAADAFPEALLHFYVARYAARQSLRACLRVLDGDPGAIVQARHHHTIFTRHAELLRTLIVVVAGAPGTGKTTLAAHICDATGWMHLRSTTVPRGSTTRVTDRNDALDEGAHSAAVTRDVYTALMKQAETVVGDGTSVVVDATFTTPASRRAVRALAARTHADLVVIECRAPVDVIRVRDRRRGDTDGEHVVSPALQLALYARRAPWPEAHPLDTTMSLSAQFVRAMRHVGETPVGEER